MLVSGGTVAECVGAEKRVVEKWYLDMSGKLMGPRLLACFADALLLRLLFLLRSCFDVFLLRTLPA